MTRQEFLKLGKAEQKVAYSELFVTIKKTLEKKGNEEGLDALKILRPTLFGSSGGRTSGTAKYVTFADMFLKVNDSVDEMKVFQAMKSGRQECGWFIKDIIKKFAPAEIKWITFNPETGIYKLVKIGPEAPKDWTGFVPMEKVSQESLDEVNLI
jgi:hypothetical protein